MTGGIGAVALSPRVPTKVFGYDVDTVGTQMFIAENIGGRRQAVPRRRRAELGLPHRLPLSLRQLEQRCARFLREIEEPRRASHLRRHALYLEAVGAH